MAKEVDPKVQAAIDKAVAAAVKAEQKRVSAALKAMEMPEGTSIRAAAAIKQSFKAALTAGE